MERITLFIRTTKEDGEVKLRFRLIDGREVQLYHKTNIKASLKDLSRFTPEGTLRPRVTLYNQELYDAIQTEIDYMGRAYILMKRNESSMDSSVFESIIDSFKAPEDKTSLIDKSLMKRFTEYVEEDIAMAFSDSADTSMTKAPSASWSASLRLTARDNAHMKNSMMRC